MKKKNYYLIVMVSVMGLLTMGSCSLLEQDLCADITCENGGSCDEGICDCPDGFSGTNCENFDSTQVQALLSNHTPIELVNGGVPLDSLYGKMYEGGFIFHLNTTDGTGMVAATVDQSAWAEWGCNNINITGATGSPIGKGVVNTMAILDAGCGVAAKLCNDLDLNGHTDWFLPSTFELAAMRENLYYKGHGEFEEEEVYWSSTQWSEDTAFALKFENSHPGGGGPKNYQFHVRAARAF